LNILILLLSLITFTSCTSLFYQPDPYLYAHPKTLGLEYDDLFFYSDDGTRLHSWYLRSKKNIPKKGFVFFFHGNAQNLSSHMMNIQWIVDHGYDVLIWDYRGYGISKGKSSSSGIYRDTKAAYTHAHNIFKNNNYPKFIVYAQSLGGNIALRGYQDFPHKKDISLLVLDSTFMSYQKIAADILRQTWVGYVLSPLAYVLVSDKYATNKAAKNVKTPTLVVHGTKDRVVPYKFGKDLYENLSAKPKWMWTIEDGIHIDVFYAHEKKYQKKFLKLLEQI
jgi:fermentation-respiration switch protein FrsA (DUF1100 family)